jgi:hypothetical protein
MRQVSLLQLTWRTNHQNTFMLQQIELCVAFLHSNCQYRLYRYIRPPSFTIFNFKKIPTNIECVQICIQLQSDHPNFFYVGGGILSHIQVGRINAPCNGVFFHTHICTLHIYMSLNKQTLFQRKHTHTPQVKEMALGPRNVRSHIPSWQSLNLHNSTNLSQISSSLQSRKYSNFLPTFTLTVKSYFSNAYTKNILNLILASFNNVVTNLDTHKFINSIIVVNTELGVWPGKYIVDT